MVIGAIGAGEGCSEAGKLSEYLHAAGNASFK